MDILKSILSKPAVTCKPAIGLSVSKKSVGVGKDGKPPSAPNWSIQPFIPSEDKKRIQNETVNTDKRPQEQDAKKSKEELKAEKQERLQKLLNANRKLYTSLGSSSSKEPPAILFEKPADHIASGEPQVHLKVERTASERRPDLNGNASVTGLLPKVPPSRPDLKACESQPSRTPDLSVGARKSNRPGGLADRFRKSQSQPVRRQADERRNTTAAPADCSIYVPRLSNKSSSRCSSKGAPSKSTPNRRNDKAYNTGNCSKGKNSSSPVEICGIPQPLRRKSGLQNCMNPRGPRSTGDVSHGGRAQGDPRSCERATSRQPEPRHRGSQINLDSDPRYEDDYHSPYSREPPNDNRYRRHQNYYDNDLDDMDDDDLDFIDDGPIEHESVSRRSRPDDDWRLQLRSVTGYNPDKYRGMPVEECTESSLDTIRREDVLSTKLARHEDALQLKIIQEEEMRERNKRPRHG